MNDLSKSLIEIAIGYLGPAGERFMARQLTHLEGGITLETITRDHLAELARWVEISSALLLDDKAKANEFAEKIKNA
jgi:hypothetical protein